MQKKIYIEAAAHEVCMIMFFLLLVKEAQIEG